MTADDPSNGRQTPVPSIDPSGDGSAALAGSTVVSVGRAIGRRVTRWIHGSAIYRWFTAEPDPDVIVIDLRETWTVGPFLRVLDRVIDRLVDASAESQAVRLTRRGYPALRDAPLRTIGLMIAVVGVGVTALAMLGEPTMTTLAVGLAMAVAGLVLMQDDRDWATLRETRPVELAIAAFEPPDPPERDTKDSEESGTDREATQETEEK